MYIHRQENIYMPDSTIHNREELIALRKHVNGCSDEQLMHDLQQDWEHGTLNEDCVDDGELDAVKRRVDNRIGKPRHAHTRKLGRWLQAAAAIALPICLLALAHLYRENRQYASLPMTQMATGADEQVTVTLPDGSKVALNALSSIKYAPQRFNMKNREVYFEGEGYYKVEKDSERPFVLHSQDIDITVLGTEFNVVNHAKDCTAEVTLLAGSVKLTSNISGRSYTMKPSEMVIVNKQTGSMDVRQLAHADDVKAWQQKQMVYHDAPLRKVISDVENRYNVEISLKKSSDDAFTGTIPTNNLDEAMKIIATAYGLKARKTGVDTYTLK